MIDIEYPIEPIRQLTSECVQTSATRLMGTVMAAQTESDNLLLSTTGKR